MAATTISTLVMALAQVQTQTDRLADLLDKLEALAAESRKCYRLPKSWAMGNRGVLALSYPFDEEELARRERLLTKLRTRARTKGPKRKPWAGTLADALETIEKWRALIAAAREEIELLAPDLDDRSHPSPARWSGLLKKALTRLRNIVRLGRSTFDDELALPPLAHGFGSELRAALGPIKAEIIDLNQYKRSDEPDDPGPPEAKLANGAPPAAANIADRPSLQLFEALNGLNTICHNTPAFRTIAEQRSRTHGTRLELLRQMARSASLRANEQLRAGAKFEEVVTEMVNATNTASEERPAASADGPSKALKKILTQARSLCDQARKAIASGGADPMDMALSPSSKARSIELRIGVGKADELFTGLELKLEEPRFMIEDDVDAMERLGESFGRARDELGAVLERVDVNGKWVEGRGVSTGESAAPNATAAAGASDSRSPRLRRAVRSPRRKKRGEPRKAPDKKARTKRRRVSTKGKSSRGASPPQPNEPVQTDPRPSPSSALESQLTRSELCVWRALHSRCMTAQALSALEELSTSRQTIVGHVQTIRTKARDKQAIIHKNGFGYWRSDAPPDWKLVEPTAKQRRIRPA